MPDLIPIYFSAIESPDELTEVDRFRFRALLMFIFSNFDLALEYHKGGLVEAGAIETYAQSIGRLLRSPEVVRSWKEEGRDMYSDGLASRIPSDEGD